MDECLQPDQHIVRLVLQGRLDDNDAVWLFKYLLSEADEAGLVYDPLFVGAKCDKFAQMDPADIGIIEAKVDMTKPGLEHLMSMEEWRVPLSSIIEYKGVT